MRNLFISSRLKTSWISINVILVQDDVPWTTLSGWKLPSGKPFPRANIVYLCFSIWRRRTTRHGNGELNEIFTRMGFVVECCALYNTLSDRTFTVRTGTALSIPFVKENGLPQRGVLSVTLFVVKKLPLQSNSYVYIVLVIW